MKSITVTMSLDVYEAENAKLSKVAKNKGWREGYTFAIDVLRERLIKNNYKSLHGDREFIKDINDFANEIKEKLSK